MMLQAFLFNDEEWDHAVAIAGIRYGAQGHNVWMGR